MNIGEWVFWVLMVINFGMSGRLTIAQNRQRREARKRQETLA